MSCESCDSSLMSNAHLTLGCIKGLGWGPETNRDGDKHRDKARQPTALAPRLWRTCVRGHESNIHQGRQKADSRSFAQRHEQHDLVETNIVLTPHNMVVLAPQWHASTGTTAIRAHICHIVRFINIIRTAVGILAYQTTGPPQRSAVTFTEHLGPADHRPACETKSSPEHVSA